MDPNLPATTTDATADAALAATGEATTDAALAATLETALETTPAGSTALEPYVGSESHWAQRPRQRQNWTVSLLPLALVGFVILVLGIALWTLAAAGSSV